LNETTRKESAMRATELRGFLRTLAAEWHELRAPWVSAQMLCSALEGKLLALQSGELDESKLHNLREISALLQETCRTGATLMDTSVALANPIRTFSPEPVEMAKVASEAATAFECITGNKVPVRVLCEQALGWADRQALLLGVMYVLRRAKSALSRDESGGMELVVSHDGQHSVLSVNKVANGAISEQAPAELNPAYAAQEDSVNEHALAFCRSAVEAFGGTIEVRELAGGGSTVILTIQDASALKW
jgi:signal transduction histidine kinase